MKRITSTLLKMDILRSMFWNLIIKGVSLVLSYVYVPLLLSYLGNEKYGLWATVLSIISWVNFCDIGISGGLRNILTKEITEEKYDEARRSISTAYIILSALAFGVWVVLSFISLLGIWHKAFNTLIDIDLVMFISITFISINLVLSIANVILYALQVSEQIAVVNLAANIINIFGLIFLKKVSYQNMTYVAILFGLSTSIPLIINNIRIYSKYKQVMPSVRFFVVDKVRYLLTIGGAFFVLQIGGLMLSSTDNVIISKMYGVSSVTPVDIASKLLGVIKGLYIALIIPIWGRTAKASTEGDYLWIKRAYYQQYVFLFIFGTFLVLVGLLFNPLAYIWLRQKFDYDVSVIVIVAIGYFAEMMNTSFYNILNGLGLIKIQIYIAIIQIICNIPLSFFLAVNCGMNTAGIKLATTILLLVGSTIYAIYIPVYIKKYGGRIDR